MQPCKRLWRRPNGIGPKLNDCRPRSFTTLLRASFAHCIVGLAFIASCQGKYQALNSGTSLLYAWSLKVTFRAAWTKAFTLATNSRGS
jgi:hypothetical protein